MTPSKATPVVLELNALNKKKDPLVDLEEETGLSIKPNNTVRALFGNLKKRMNDQLQEYLEFTADRGDSEGAFVNAIKDTRYLDDFKIFWKKEQSRCPKCGISEGCTTHRAVDSLIVLADLLTEARDR